jgi:hypothetical protein
VLSFLPVRPAAAPIRDAWATVDPDRVRVASAFASDAGIAELVKAVGKAAFEAADKQWLIGIYEGVTRPGALTRLREADRSEVRVPFGRETLEAPEMRASRLFHPKAYCFENTSSSAVAIVSTSANLTQKGLVANVEQVKVWIGKRSEVDAVTFDDWWQSFWAEADLATEAFTREYEERRPKRRVGRGPSGGEPSASTLRRATSLWIELKGKPASDSHNQVELLSTGYLFFFPSAKNPGRAKGHRLTFEDRLGKVYDARGRQITFHGPDRGERKGNKMWRVYMPTLAEGFGGYQDGDVLVRFQRTATPDHYLIEVAPSGSQLALDWIEGSTYVESTRPPPRRMGWS